LINKYECYASLLHGDEPLIRGDKPFQDCGDIDGEIGEGQAYLQRMNELKNELCARKHMVSSHMADLLQEQYNYFLDMSSDRLSEIIEVLYLQIMWILKKGDVENDDRLPKFIEMWETFIHHYETIIHLRTPAEFQKVFKRSIIKFRAEAFRTNMELIFDFKLGYCRSEAEEQEQKRRLQELFDEEISIAEKNFCPVFRFGGFLEKEELDAYKERFPQFISELKSSDKPRRSLSDDDMSDDEGSVMSILSVKRSRGAD